MDGRSLILGSGAAVASAAGGLAALAADPGGRLAANRLLLLAGSTAAGLVVAWLTRPVTPRAAGRWEKSWPAVVALAAAAVAAAAFLVPYPLARAAADELCDRLPGGAHAVAVLGDCRRLEELLEDAAESLAAVPDIFARYGLTEHEFALADGRVRERVGAMPVTGALPTGPAEQRGRIADRLRSRADTLASAATATRLRSLTEWADRVRADVRRLTADTGAIP